MFSKSEGNISPEDNVPVGEKRPRGAGHRIAAGDEARRAEKPAIETPKRFAPCKGATLNAISYMPMTSLILASFHGADKFGNIHH